MRYAATFAFVLFASAGVASADPEPLTLARALELAAQQQPNLRAARAGVEAARGRVDAAHVIEHPTANLTATAAVGSTRGGSMINSGGFFTPGLDTGLSASASYRIYDFGLTRANIRAAELSAEATEAGVGSTVLDVRRDVELAYLEAVARARLIEVARTTVASEEAHLDQARKFVAAQAHDPIEVAQAQARAANAKSALAQAQSNDAIARANLRAAIGSLDLQDIVVDLRWPAVEAGEPGALATLVATARTRRPEITQLDKQIAAGQASVDAARLERRPVLSAAASTQWNPSSDNWSPEPSWQVGLTLSWALFDGGRSAADVRIANANVQSTMAQRDSLLVSLTSQLDAARAQIVANNANVSASTEAVTAARAQLNLAEARYAQGLGSQIELADAQTAVTTANGNLVLAEWQLAEAWAALRRALGEN